MNVKSDRSSNFNFNIEPVKNPKYLNTREKTFKFRQSLGVQTCEDFKSGP